ncbi:MAG: HD domain-containing phosphohydrolase [Clostridia bacterium]
MVHGYPQGLSKSDIPYEAQIIRVADEYDAIVSKRQYKSHIGISDTLKILIENAQNGKNNPKIVKKLIKIVIEDIEYEIYLTGSYIDNLSSELSRFKQIESYREYMEKAKKEKDKNYYLEGMKVLLRDGETIENYMNIYNEYQDAYNARKAIIDNLYKEIKIIKKLKV